MYKRKTKIKPVDVLIIGAVIAMIAFFIYRINVGLNYNWNWHKIPQFLFRYDAENQCWVSNILMRGLYNTVRLSVWGVILATILGTIMGVLRSSKILFFRLISGAYVETMRNVPPLVIIFIIYFFIGDQLMPSQDIVDFLESRSETVQGLITFLFAKPAYVPSFLSALLTLTIFEGAYITEIVRAGIQSIRRGQWEASCALGLSWPQQMRHIILPQAFRRILPPLAGQFISLIKDSSIVSVISIQELTFQGTELMTSTLLTMEIWITVTILYLILTLPCSLGVQKLEEHFEKRKG